MGSDKQRLKLTVEDCNTEFLEHKLEERTAELEHEKIETEVVLHSLGEAMYVVDRDHIVRMMNPYAAELLGYESPDEVIGRPLAEVVPALDEKGNKVPLMQRSNVRAFVQKAPKDTWSVSAYFVRKDGAKFPVQVTTTAISIDEDRMGAITVFRDITREKKIEQAKTEFISLAAHQLRTPISVILLNLELITKYYRPILENGNEDAQETQKSLSEISGAATMLAELVDTLLNISKIEMGTLTVAKEKVELRPLVEQEVERCASLAAEKQEKFLANVDEDVPNTIVTDKRLLSIILQNLISNAVKYNRDGGTVGVGIKRSQGNIRISVSDEGIGIPQDAQDHVFKKFFRADNVSESHGSGVGLGLYLASTAVKELGGVMWLESSVGHGSTFYFEIPLVEE